MADFLLLLSAMGFVILMTKFNGPFNILQKLRSFFIDNKYIGVIAHKIINCAFCSGFWLGLIYYICLYEISKYAIIFAFATAFSSYLFAQVME